MFCNRFCSDAQCIRIALVDDLYATLSEQRRLGYEATIKAEYARPGQQVTYGPFGAGVLGTIAIPAPGEVTLRLVRHPRRS